MCINEKEKGHLPDGNLSMYMRYFVPAGSIYISTPFPIINYCSSILNCFCCFPEVMLIKFQNLYTPTNRSNFRNFNEDDRKRQKFNNNKCQLVF